MEILSDNNYYLSDLYENSLSENDKKALGIYYTPKYIIDYIVSEILLTHDFKSNPCPKILDMSCGCGNFLLEVYDVLYGVFESRKYELNIKDIHSYIITNCIYGIDIDLNAVNVLKHSLKNKDTDSDIDEFNVYCFDSLIGEGIDDNLKKIFWEEKFDYIIGNPPYIGHKNLSIKYKKQLIKIYGDVYRDKSDIYFCFYKRIIDLLKQNGTASIITPRYFIESQSGEKLRKYIIDNVNIKEIVDFNGFNVFKNANVASCIFTMEKTDSIGSNFNFYRFSNYDIDLKYVENIKSTLENDNCFTKININQSDMKENWIIDKKENIDLYNKIEKTCEYKLKDICTSFQGIITGCDKAFVIKNDEIESNYIEKDILKNWIKNKNIKKYYIENSDLKLIYSDDINNLKHYVESIKYIKNYREKLENRRECKKNTRKWYQLQWGRDKHNFEQKKIMFPYKSNENRFAIDEKYSFCSADVYSFYIKKEYEEQFSYEYLVGLLNSDVYDNYFKVFAKKMGKNLYDYYPNKVMDISIFKDENYKEIEKLSKEIIKIVKFDNKLNEEVNYLQQKIETLIKHSLKLNSLI
ncbi:Eco57I restriction-modification methylase domain-containing protein [Paraclostridium ghonii]|uniref:Eco57I restriction-modification methylase domain-containing protein n=1 Tax=Paraclostridium ghonii TaxID=29358 RepID=UPI0035244149